ncbi:MAG: type II toxin-antitoxin system RelE/ParE family toxin [Spirochaetes bacterium]|nr:type II toxin-antitoxin system RelE/ParE family toxin [Spirochaetota bacterium]
MKKMEILYSSKAAKQLKKIAKGDRNSAQMILQRIESYTKNPSKHHDVKLLKGRYGIFKRLRAGNYRVIFDDNNRIMHIYEIKQRQGAYND